ncbi:MAG: hypothetical protein C0412_19255, partial [Flavobacterium sp.]|nr:hypothetical protein [Flavobacterium sp.]
GAYNSLVGLTHELRHGYQDAQGAYPTSFQREGELEKDAVNFTNYMRSVYDMGPMRTTYNKYGLRFSEDESIYNPYGEKIQGFRIQQNWLNGVTPSYLNTTNSNVDNTRVSIFLPGVRAGQEMIYRKVYNVSGEIINVNKPLK